MNWIENLQPLAIDSMTFQLYSIPIECAKAEDIFRQKLLLRHSDPFSGRRNDSEHFCTTFMCLVLMVRYEVESASHSSHRRWIDCYDMGGLGMRTRNIWNIYAHDFVDFNAVYVTCMSWANHLYWNHIKSTFDSAHHIFLPSLPLSRSPSFRLLIFHWRIQLFRGDTV